MDDGNRWLTYQELADARDINRRSAVRLAQRRRWLRRPGNDGTTRVAVPIGEDQPKHDDGGDDACDAARDDAGDDAGDISRIVSALEVVVAPLREELEIANRRAERAEVARDVALGQLRMAEELLKQAQIERAVEAAAARSALFGWLRRGKNR
jgi:hypothetical protein